MVNLVQYTRGSQTEVTGFGRLVTSHVLMGCLSRDPWESMNILWWYFLSLRSILRYVTLTQLFYSR